MIIEGHQQHHDSAAFFRNSQYLRSTSVDPTPRSMHSPEDSNAAAILFNPSGSGSPSPLDLANLAGLSRDMSNQMLAAQQAALQAQRKQREFIPDTKKDDSYWDRRRRNNEAAKRSREKRRLNDMVLEQRVLELYKENHVLRAQLSAIREKYGVTGENLISVEQVLASLPSLEQLVSVTRSRSRASSSPILSLGSPQSLPALASPSIQQQQQQRQSVLMISRHQDSSLPPTPCDERQSLQFERRHSIEESSKASSRWLPPIPALNPVNGTKTLQVELPKTVPYYDICSPGSSCDDGSQSPVDPAVSGRLLPHKLRHKTHLGDRDAAAAAALLTLNDIKDEQELLEEENLRSAGSSDERDSGVSTADWTRAREASESEEQPAPKKRKHSSEVKPSEEDQEIRSQISRLVSEVERLKSLVTATRGAQFHC